jgi:hypothetical protein
MELNHIYFPDDAVHIYGFDGEDTGVLELNVMTKIDAMHCHS